MLILRRLNKAVWATLWDAFLSTPAILGRVIGSGHVCLLRVSSPLAVSSPFSEP